VTRRTGVGMTVTVDPDVLEAIDAYIEQHAGLDRSQVVDEALRAWYMGVIHESLVRQHAAPRSVEEQNERAAWKRIRAAQVGPTEGRFP